jgi:hypothetical protein
MDFAVYHSYGEADPARYVAKLSADFVQRYQKPVMIGEIGTSHLNWNIANDPYLRGFRQGIWGGLLGGSVGTSMSWWWEGIHDDQAYPLYTVLRDVMNRAGWNKKTSWAPARFSERGTPPLELAKPGDNAELFNAQIPLNQLRLNPVSGEAAISDPLAAARAAERISSYLHGTNNPQLQQHARLNAWFGENARLIFRVNSVAANADLVVRIDDAEKLRAPLVNKDGLATLNDEINQEFTVEIPSGLHRIEIAHTGTDWINLKSVRLERVRSSAFASGWKFATEAIGLSGPSTTVIYVRSPHVAWPAGALRYNPPLVHGDVINLLDWQSSHASVVWIDPRTGQELSKTEATAKDKQLPLTVPDYNEDLIGLITRR